MLREPTAELSRRASTAASATKIRKRCAAAVSPPSSSESQRRRKPRVKRSVRLVGRRMSEPSPWSSRHHHRHADAEARSAASARKLVSALWQLNGNKGRGGGASVEEEGGVVWDAAAARRGSADHRRSASLEFSKLTRRKSKALKDDGERSWHHGHAHGQWFSDVMSNGGALEVHTCPQGRTPARHGDRTAQAQELYNSLAASNELVRVLDNVLGPAGGLSPTAASVLAALRSELDAARSRARQLTKRPDDGGESTEVRLRRQLAEEVRAWKSRHREKAAVAARLVASELDGERRARRRAERVGKKLAEALADAEASLRAATRELERERASRERLEKVCDELAGGVGAEEKLRREAATVMEELEREREMLQLADELREERVRMKLAEARLQFEEKNAVVDRLRQELEDFLGTGRDRHDEPPELVDDDHRLQLVLASEFGVDGIDPVATLTGKRGQEEIGGEADDGSDGSDIELNMDGNSWSYTNTSRETTAGNAAASVLGSLSDRGGTECAAAAAASGGASERRSDGMRDAFIGEKEWDDDDDDRTSTKDLDEDAERYEAIKNLREQMLAGHGFVFLSQSEADANRDRRPHGLASHIEDGCSAGEW